ncbi:MAG: AAA family ATPase [Actinomycetota bacterium]|nr:AAA family ATPase [Actinomycetota bacterium]
MARTRQVLECSGCGHQVAQWVGRCPGCGEWGSIGERRAPSHLAAPVSALTDASPVDEKRIASGFSGLDRVLGGGVVPGSVILLAGEPGIGKSTLLLQVAGAISAAGGRCLVASGEETRGQVAARADRLGLASDHVSFVSGRQLAAVVAAASDERPAVLMVDSIQAIRDETLSSLPGGPAQVRSSTDALVGMAKSTGVSVILAGQVTKDGEIAGPRTLEHAVDVTCTFEAADGGAHRVLTGGKNRFGPEGEVAWFEMGTSGLKEVDGGALLGSGDREVGAATALVSAGRRGIAVQVQALVGSEGPPRRNVSGLDPRRFGIVAAVVDRALDLGLGRRELYGSSAGGMRVDDAGADLAIAAALVSAATGAAPPAGSAFCGEVSLTGAVRPVGGPAVRMAAAAGGRIARVFAPSGWSGSKGIRVVEIRRVADALRWTNGNARPDLVASDDRPA